MIINSLNNFSKIQPENKPKSIEDTTLESKIQEPSAELPKADAETLKAYSGIVTKKEYVSEKKLFDYLREKNFNREDLFEHIAQALSDQDGKISQTSFDFFRNYQDKNYPIGYATKIFIAAKEDGKINYNALKVADKLINKKSGLMYSKTLDVASVLDKAKNKDGTFNKDVLEIISNNSEILKKVFELKPNYIFNILKNNSNEFSEINIDYVKTRALDNVDILKILTEIQEAKNQNGDFSSNIKNLKEYINSTFDNWSKNLVASIVFSFPDDATDKRANFLQLAESYKNERDFSDVLSFIRDKKQDENDKSSLDYNKKSFDFVNDMLKACYGDKEKLSIVLKKIGYSYDKIEPNELETIKKLCSLVETKDVETFIDAATYKVGDKKGQFCVSNLEKYLDIYSKNRFFIGIEDIKYIAGCLELEEDDEALTLLQKLHNQRWKTDAKNYSNEEMLNKGSINGVLSLLCFEVDGHATRPCYKEAVKRLSKLFELQLPMSSKGAFENFMFFQEMNVIDKLQKVNFEELGINTGEVTCGVFKDATEEQLLQFKEYLKEYLKDKNVKNISIELNRNVSSIVELTTGTSLNNTKLLYDFKTGKPITELKSLKFGSRLKKSQKDFQNNTISTQLFDIKKEGPYGMFEIPVLIEQSFEKHDKDENLLFTETMKKSPVDNVYNIQKVYPDGRVENICTATKTKDGNDIVEKHMESFDGTKTDSYYEDDPQGNRIFDYKITDKNGKVLMNNSVTFEVLDENHFISSRNNKKFDIQIKDRGIIVKNLQNNKTAFINIEKFTEYTQDQILPLLKQIPGDELFAMKELNLKAFALNNKTSNAAFSPSTNAIMFNEKYLDLGVALHEWGHGKDNLAFSEIGQEICEDPVLNNIYKEEKEAFRKYFSDAQLEHIGYFAADYHYLGGKKAIKEGIAETNTILNICPKNDTQAVRSHYWQQYFPKTIAYLSSLLN